MGISFFNIGIFVLVIVAIVFVVILLLKHDDGKRLK
jgi:hypothetical protein